VNHAPSPNSRIQKWYHGDTENLAIVSIQRIEYNQEITVDYRDHLRRFDT
jgi:SET domain-containing protein